MAKHKRTKAEKRLVEAAEDVLDEQNTQATVLKLDDADKVVAAGDAEVLPVIIPVAAGETPKPLDEMSPTEQEAFLENAPAELREQVRKQMSREPND
jgi:hypothetical protein